MSIVEKMKEHQKEKEALDLKARLLKREFEAYIANKAIPLLERWDIFAGADDAFKNHSQWLMRPQSQGLKHVVENWFDAPEVYGRGKRICTKEIFKECVGLDQLHPENFNSSMDEEKSMQLLTQALEEILEKNMGSFCYDW